MDIATVIGIVAGFGLIVGSILMESSLGAFINTPGLLIVVGGTIAAALISESLKNVIGAAKVMKNAFKAPSSTAVETIEQIIKFSNIARKEGVVALEDQKTSNQFLAKGIQLAVDGITPEEIQDTLQLELFGMKQRHQRGSGLFRFLAATAPSMGMIGTLIGLVQMLQNLSDPGSIGPAMAVALLTTMYGAVLAFLVFGPIAEKLEKYSKEEAVQMQIVIDGVDALIKGQNGRMIKERLEAHLAPQGRNVNLKKAAA